MHTPKGETPEWMKKKEPARVQAQEKMIVTLSDDSSEGRLERIKKRISFLPKKMARKEAILPMMVKDPCDETQMIEDPHERISQRRMDIIDADDPFKKPLIHFHTIPDHQFYEKDWEQISDAFINMRGDIEFLIQQLGESRNDTTLE